MSLFIADKNALAATCASVATGNWNARTTWGTAATGCAGAPGGIPGTGDNVNIANLNHTVTVTDNRSANSITFPAGSGFPNLTISAGVTLAVTNNMTVNGANGGSGTRRVTVGADAVLNVGGDLIMNGGSNNSRDTQLLLNDGPNTAVNVAGDFGATATGGNFNGTARMFITFNGRGTISIGRNFGGNAMLTSGSGTIVANGSVNQGLGAYGTAASNYYNLVISKSGGTATLAGNAMIRGDVTDNGNFNPAAGNRTVTFQGTAMQNLFGSAANTPFYRVTLNNGNGLNLGHDLNITNLLTLTSGQVVTGANRVYIQNGSNISGAGGLKFVVGNLAKNYITGSNITRVFEVGSLTGGARYAPVNIRLGQVTGAGDFTVSTTATDHPQIGTSAIEPAKSVNRYWTLTNNSVSFAANANNRVIFTFVNPADFDAGVNTANFFVGRYTAGAWTGITPSGRTTTTTTISGTGITAATIPGDYQIGEQKPAVPAPGSFNAFESGTPAGAITGAIRTKVAGSAFSLDVEAISGGTQLAGFTDQAIVELLGNNTLGVPLDVNNCPTTFTLVQTVGVNPMITAGRSTVNFAAVADSWRDVRVRVRWSTATPTVTSCSTDNFAIRPSAFANFSVTDTDWQSPGTGRTLNDTAFGTVTHKAGRPFSVRANAVNAAGSPAITTNYTGTPTATITPCAGAACTATFGTLTLNSAFAAGQLVSDVASYDNVGAVQLQLVDSSFASVDSADGSTAAERNIISAVIDVGRFVPDHFAVSLNTPALGTACGAGSFTYVGQKFSYITPPIITLQAQNFANATTTLYTGSWWRMTNASLTGKSYTVASGALDTSGITGGTDPVISDAGGGSGTLTFGSGSGLLFTRTTPVVPFNAELSLAVNVIDADGVAASGNPVSFGAATPGNGIGFNNGKEMRFGVLRSVNVSGSDLLPLSMRMELQYWNGTAFITNATDSCTTIAANNIEMSNFTQNLNPCETSLTVGAFAQGRATAQLSAPGGANSGGVILIPHLEQTVIGSPQTCIAGALQPVVGADRFYLEGKWDTIDQGSDGRLYDDNPAARGTFGVYRGPDEVIYMREIY